MAEKVYYRAERSFYPTPDQSNCIVLEIGDILEVNQYDEPSNGWMLGKRLQTEDYGYFPQSYVQLCSLPMEKPVPKPRMPKVMHNVLAVYVVRPILCAFCNDYIWGTKKVAVQCQECDAVFHDDCNRKKVPCSKRHSANPVLTYKREVSLDEWSEINVIEWLAVLNLYRYAESFRHFSVKGRDLASLNEERLKELKISNNIYQKAILVAIDELCGRQTYAGVSPDIETRVDEGCSASDHALSIQNFTELQRCHMCNKFLWGITRQGYCCPQCGLCCHRKCAAAGLPRCSQDYPDRPMLAQGSVFGESLSQQLAANQKAPFVLILCTEELERRARELGEDLFEVYRMSVPASEVNELKHLFSFENPAEVSLSKYSSSCIAGTIKRYLRELPDTLIPESLYDKFIAAAKLPDKEARKKGVLSLVKELPDAHSKTLHFLMAHFCHVCRLQKELNRHQPLSRVSQVFCHILMRPPWENIINIVHNIEFHVRVFELLLEGGQWVDETDATSPPPLPPRPGGSNTDTAPIKGQRLEDMDWYHGDISRDEVTEMLRNTPDGTFLVRNAANRAQNEYTLTVMVGGSSRLIKIGQKDGKCGFVEPYRFNSVVELINHHRDHSLEQYNRTLKTNLKYPVSRNHPLDDDLKSPEAIKRELLKCHKEYIAKTKEYDKKYNQYLKTTQEIGLRQQALEAFKETVAVFEEQLTIQENYQKHATAPEMIKLQKNRDLLNQRLIAYQKSRTDLEEGLIQQAKTNRALVSELNAMKPDIKRLYKQREHHKKWLQERGKMKMNQIEALLYDMESNLESKDSSEVDNLVDRVIETSQQELVIPHYNEKTWLVDTDRAGAEQLLSSKCFGTFLIRPKGHGTYALSVVVPYDEKLPVNRENRRPGDPCVVHCKIEKRDSGYGFSEPYFIHKDLLDLVLHYRITSLVEHNETMDIMLKHPVYEINQQHEAVPTNNMDSTGTYQSMNMYTTADPVREK